MVYIIFKTLEIHFYVFNLIGSLYVNIKMLTLRIKSNYSYHKSQNINEAPT